MVQRMRTFIELDLGRLAELAADPSVTMKEAGDRMHVSRATIVNRWREFGTFEWARPVWEPDLEWLTDRALNPAVSPAQAGAEHGVSGWLVEARWAAHGVGPWVWERSLPMIASVDLDELARVGLSGEFTQRGYAEHLGVSYAVIRHAWFRLHIGRWGSQPFGS